MRGDLALIVKQQSLTGFNVKLTPMGKDLSTFVKDEDRTARQMSK